MFFSIVGTKRTEPLNATLLIELLHLHFNLIDSVQRSILHYLELTLFECPLCGEMVHEATIVHRPCVTRFKPQPGLRSRLSVTEAHLNNPGSQSLSKVFPTASLLL